MAPFIDTHVHLTWPSFEGQVDQVIERARQAGVGGLVDLGTNVETSRQAREHAHQYEGVWFAAGVHPNDAADAHKQDLELVEKLIADERCVAVGEIGLDFYRDHTEPHLQEKWFRNQLHLAKWADMPVVIHDRIASARLLQVLEEEDYDGLSGPGGVFHCFAGTVGTAREVIDRGFHISFTGNITFKNTDRIEVVKEVPLERIMIETDSPFMAPVPHRGKQNEPSFVPYVAAQIAKIKGLSLEEVARVTTENAIRFFKLPAEVAG